MGNFYSYSANSQKPLPETGDGQMVWAGSEGLGDSEFRDQPHKVGSETTMGGNVIVSDTFFVGTKQAYNQCVMNIDDFTKEIELAQNYYRANGHLRIIGPYRQLDTDYCIRDACSNAPRFMRGLGNIKKQSTTALKQ